MLKNMKIGVRLGAGFGILLVLFIGVGSLALWGIRTSTETTITMLRGDAALASDSERARANLVGMRRYEKDAFLNIGDAEKVREYEAKWQEQLEHLQERIHSMEKNALADSKDKEVVTKLKADLPVYEKGARGVFAKIAAGAIKTPQQANQAILEFKDESHRMEETAKDFATTCMEHMQANEPLMRALERRLTILMASGLLVAVLLSLAIGFFLTRSITRPLGDAVTIANRIAEGELATTVAVERGDELGILLAAMARMVENLRKMVANIRETSALVSSAATEIAASSTQLAKSAHAQASASEETSSTMVQMAASIQTVANNADSLAGSTNEVSSSIVQLGASSEEVARSSETMASSVAETSATIEQMTVSIEKVARNADDLGSSVSETSSTIEQMTVSVDQVASKVDELVATVGESSATIQQLAASIASVTENVAEADTLAKGSAKEAAAGAQAGQEAVGAMSRVTEVIEKTSASILNLGKRSQEIGNIVKVINEIADQTNLLALNAAIEAARAGDAGRGFAVVADEVRKLAERSVVATKEIAQVIREVQNDTAEAVKYGEIASREASESMDMATVAGKALDNIVASVSRTSDLMTAVASMAAEQAKASTRVIAAAERMTNATEVVSSAAREQAAGGRQIRIAVERMNRITEEVTGATREQVQGSKQIRIAVENMNRVTGQVTIATKEQALSARQIVDAVTAMTAMTQTVADATAEQKKGGTMVVAAVENISDLARQNLSAVDQLTRAAENLGGQAVTLTEMVSQFRI